MEPGVRIAAAASVLLAGMLVALLFRHCAPGTETTVPGSGDRLVLGEQLQRQVAGPAEDQPHGRPESPPRGSSAARAAGQKAIILTPLDAGEAPPVLAKDYPGDGVPAMTGWGTSLGFLPSTRNGPAMRKHKIVDGDTLPALAERYLGSPDRCPEIYEANRELLPSPGLLPIGVDLTIPPQSRQTPPSSGPAPKRAVVPIPHGATGEE